MDSGAGINIDPVAVQAEALRNSYFAVRDEVARFEHDVRDDAVSTVMGPGNAGTYDQSTAQAQLLKWRSCSNLTHKRMRFLLALVEWGLRFLLNQQKRLPKRPLS